MNVETMTGKVQLVDMMQRRKPDIFYVQETRWKAIKARNFRAGFKLFYHSADRKRNEVGVISKGG